MANYLKPEGDDPLPNDIQPEPGLERRRSRNPLRSMMQHLTVDPPSDSDTPHRESLMRRLSRRSSRRSSAKTSPASSRPPTASERDPDLCKECADWADNIASSFDEVDDFFSGNTGGDDGHGEPKDGFLDKGEFLMMPLPNLKEDRWASKCPLCKLFFECRAKHNKEAGYILSGFSSRDTNYILDSNKLFQTEHLAKKNDRAYCPAFMGVVQGQRGLAELGGLNSRAEWFRDAQMLFRTQPSLSRADNNRKAPPDSYAGNRGLSPHPPELQDTVSYMSKGIWGREIGPAVDIGIARRWLNFCETHHRNRCGNQDHLTWNVGRGGFHLLDVSKTPPQIVKASSKERYCALSYVCGQNMTERWPRVFQDAVTVTQELGIAYLWIDRLCLSEDLVSGAERIHQIKHMDEIYGRAAITIIAAHGHDATFGLAGVNYTHRREQPKYTFRGTDITIVSSLRDPRVVIKESLWWTRGWGYSEGFCARRRLIFTEEQMYWECEGAACPEALQIPLELYHDPQKQRFCDFMRPGLFNGVSYVDEGWEVWRKRPQDITTLGIFRELDLHIVNYSRRKLGNDQDRLNAFYGIQNKVRGITARNSLGNLAGVPIWAPYRDETEPGSDPSPRVRVKDAFAISTSYWHHKEVENVRRLPNLPSWSWAGWTGAIELFSSIQISDPTGAAPDTKEHSHHYVALTKFLRNEPTSMMWTYSPDMTILDEQGAISYEFSNGPIQRPPSTSTSHAKIYVRNPIVLDKVKARVLPNGSWMFNDISLNVKMSTPEGKAGGIRGYIESHARGEQMTVLWFMEELTVLLLVVQKKGDSWERVGRVRMGIWGAKEVVLKQAGNLSGVVGRLPLRPLGRDIIIV